MIKIDCLLSPNWRQCQVAFDISIELFSLGIGICNIKLPQWKPVEGLMVSSRGRAGNTFKWQCLKTLNQSCKKERSMTSFAAMSSSLAQGQISIVKHGFPWTDTMMQETASENTAGILRICRESREKIWSAKNTTTYQWSKAGYYKESLTGQEPDRVQTESQELQPSTAAFLQAVWTMHSVGAKWTVAIVFPTEDSIHLWPQGKTNEHF